MTVTYKDGEGQPSVSRTEAGTSPMVLDAKDFTATSPNYEKVTVEVENGWLNILPNNDEVELTITGNANTVTYDGTEQSVAGFTFVAVQGEETLDNGQFSVSLAEGSAAKASGTNAGTYNMDLTKGDFVVESTNYSNIKVSVVDGSLTINTRSVSVVTDSASKVYDGTPLTAPGRVENLVEGESVTVNTSELTAVGTTDNLYTIDWDNANEANYTITGEAIGTLTVTAQSITPGEDPDNPDPSYVDVQVNYPADVPYNGQDQTWVPTVTGNARAALVAGTDYDVTYSTNDRTNVTGDITVTITGKGNYKGTVERHYQITPLTITVTPNNVSKYVGQDDPTLTSTYAGYIQGETAGWTGSLTREPGEAVGTYVISQGDLQLADNANGNFLAQNYRLVVNDGVFTILAVPGGGGTTTTPGGGTTTPTPGAPAIVATGADDATDEATETEEAIDDDTTPLASPSETIDDDGTPLASGRHEDCWVHWFILLGMILSAVYFVGVSVRRRKFTSSLLGYEDKVLGNDRDNA